MPSVMIEGLVIIFIAIVFLLIIYYERSIRKRDIGELKKLESKIGLRFNQDVRGRHLTGNYKGKNVVLSYIDMGTGKRFFPYTNIQIEIKKGLSCNIKIRKKEPLIINSDFKIGISNFDNNFSITFIETEFDKNGLPFISENKKISCMEEIKDIFDIATIKRMSELDLLAFKIENTKMHLEISRQNYDQTWIANTLDLCVELAEKIDKVSLESKS